MQFYKLARGARFEYQGKRYQKITMDFAQEEGGPSRHFPREWEVNPIGEPLLLSEAEAEKWRPIDWRNWADHLTPAPGQGETH